MDAHIAVRSFRRAMALACFENYSAHVLGVDLLMVFHFHSRTYTRMERVAVAVKARSPRGGEAADSIDPSDPDVAHTQEGAEGRLASLRARTTASDTAPRRAMLSRWDTSTSHVGFSMCHSFGESKARDAPWTVSKDNQGTKYFRAEHSGCAETGECRWRFPQRVRARRRSSCSNTLAMRWISDARAPTFCATSSISWSSWRAP